MAYVIKDKKTLKVLDFAKRFLIKENDTACSYFYYNKENKEIVASNWKQLIFIKFDLQKTIEHDNRDKKFELKTGMFSIDKDKDKKTSLLIPYDSDELEYPKYARIIPTDDEFTKKWLINERINVDKNKDYNLMCYAISMELEIPYTFIGTFLNNTYINDIYSTVNEKNYNSSGYNPKLIINGTLLDDFIPFKMLSMQPTKALYMKRSFDVFVKSSDNEWIEKKNAQ